MVSGDEDYPINNQLTSLMFSVLLARLVLPSSLAYWMLRKARKSSKRSSMLDNACKHSRFKGSCNDIPCPLLWYRWLALRLDDGNCLPYREYENLLAFRKDLVQELVDDDKFTRRRHDMFSIHKWIWLSMPQEVWAATKGVNMHCNGKPLSFTDCKVVAAASRDSAASDILSSKSCQAINITWQLTKNARSPPGFSIIRFTPSLTSFLPWSSTSPPTLKICSRSSVSIRVNRR